MSKDIIKQLWNKLSLPWEVEKKDEDYHLEDGQDRFPRQLTRPGLLAYLMAYTPRGTFLYTLSTKRKHTVTLTVFTKLVSILTPHEYVW